MERHLIFLDLDGTLLNSAGHVTEDTRAALRRAAEAGHTVIPATGRFFLGMPEEIRSLDFTRYAITINGAQIYDKAVSGAVYRCEMPISMALQVFREMDVFPAIYDCFAGDWGWMERAGWEQAEKYSMDHNTLTMIKELRRPVDNFKEYIGSHFESIQKTQMFFYDMDARREALAYLTDKLPDCCVASSIKNNIEVNIKKANKGEAILALCRMLDVPPENTIAFGDSTNDLAMIETCGVGVAMGNSCPEILSRADMVTLSNDEDGVAAALRELLKL